MLSTTRQPAEKLELLEAIRGFAASYVVIHHFIGFTTLKQTLHPLLRLPFRFGQEAVIVFFLMSGFVICIATYKSSQQDIRTFFYKRFFRIYPIFLATLGLSVLVALCNGESFSSKDTGNFLGNLLMLQDTPDKPGGVIQPFLKNHALWSLSYEWWFYMLFLPVLTLLNKIKYYYTGPSIYSVLALSCVAYLFYLLFPNHLLLVLTYLVMWWVGVAWGEMYVKQISFNWKNMLPLYVSLFVMLCLTAIPAITAYQATQSVSNLTDYPFIVFRHFAFAFLCVGSIHFYHIYKLTYLKTVFVPFAKLSSISYALYCVHFPILWLHIPFITNIYIALFAKLMLVVALSHLLKNKLQPIVNKYSYALRTSAAEIPVVVNA
ncbi:acyltransferase family protein [Hymenobacter defluvii]|uniref:Acyltransferase n=1 Tax=Hymenobacter defluvii TaxID=2054411 RepID=A0ABS3T9K6_9BACT|nr:acyltransferase [Hymenobacter defluvii]MBO3270327.1 acyltransferase [Hymenobacter defluvii]